MRENFRLAFSIAWIVATGACFALALLMLFTWNFEYLPYLYAGLAVWCISSIGTVVTSI
jgi:hypothetical protein